MFGCISPCDLLIWSAPWASLFEFMVARGWHGLEFGSQKWQRVKLTSNSSRPFIPSKGLSSHLLPLVSQWVSQPSQTKSVCLCQTLCASCLAPVPAPLPLLLLAARAGFLQASPAHLIWSLTFSSLALINRKIRLPYVIKTDKLLFFFEGKWISLKERDLVPYVATAYQNRNDL